MSYGAFVVRQCCILLVQIHMDGLPYVHSVLKPTTTKDRQYQTASVKDKH